MAINHYLCCFPELTRGSNGMIICFTVVQFVYTFIVWGILANSHPINHVYIVFFYIIGCLALKLLCNFQTHKDHDNNSDENTNQRKERLAVKCIPVAALIMTGFSLLIFFIGFFEMINDPLNMYGAIFVVIISAVFSLLWIQIFFVSSADVRKLLEENKTNDMNIRAEVQPEYENQIIVRM